MAQPADYHGGVSGPAVPGGVVHKLPADLRKALIANVPALDAWRDITPLARVATGHAELLTVHDADGQPAAYVGIERVTGTLGGDTPRWVARRIRGG
jgi:hypothetical protein